MVSDSRTGAPFSSDFATTCPPWHIRRQMSLDIAKFAQSFPSLANADGLMPWDPGRLDRWVIGPAGSSHSLHSARFVLTLWDRNEPWLCGTFNVFDALAEWDQPHREAFRCWAENPCWPER